MVHILDGNTEHVAQTQTFFDRLFKFKKTINFQLTANLPP